MLYVFHVDTGTMMTFDMSLVSESVTILKKCVERATKIECDKQVLLVSGGECLDPSARVGSYSCGTDTNPIFLFSKSVIESTTPPAASVDYGSDFDFKEKVKEATGLPADYATVVRRTQLAQQFHELAKDQTRVCERLVHDQHLQQQGWAAVVANLEDITTEFKKRSEICEKSFSDYLDEHDSYLKFLLSFNDDLQMLSKIPILPALLESEKTFLEAHGSDQVHAGSGTAEDTEVAAEENKPLTLLEWISAADNKSSMDQLFELCSNGLAKFDQRVFDAIHQEIGQALSSEDNPDMKEVKGLGDRLYGLEQLMVEARRYVQEQGDLAQSFQQNQTRAGNIGDKSILPDLCASHRKQLLVMLHNHQQLCDIRRRCTRAKEELSVNLYHRLRWVMYVENKILETSNKLFIYHENLKRLRKHLEVLQQIHLAPATYLTAVAEVVRRRKFSQAFLLWASELACHLLTIHNDEVTRRKEFQSQFEGHFLNSLFPGMEDLPPSFATQAPSIFDSTLPKIAPEDIDRLKEALPELSENLAVFDISAILNFFMVKSEIKSELDKADDCRDVEEKLVQVVNEVGLASNLDQNLLKPTDSETCLLAHGLPHLKDLDKGCESETDTEEFEKVCQSPLELQFDKEIPSPRPGTQDASTLTEVGEKNPVPPKKQPRTAFQKPHISTQNSDSCCSLLNANLQRTLSISGSQSNTESFSNIKNPSLESIDELSSLRNFPSNTESCFNSHHQQVQSYTSTHFLRSKSLSPHTPQSPKDMQTDQLSPNSPVQVHQPSEFVTDEYYIDESLPSSLSIEAGHCHTDFAKQLDTANDVVALLQENLETSHSEQDRLRSNLMKMSSLSQQAISELRREVTLIKSVLLLETTNLKAQCESLNNSWESLSMERDNKEREIIQKLTVDHEMELGDYKRAVEARNEEVQCLRDENSCLETRVKVISTENSDMKKEIDKLTLQKEDETNNLRKCLLEMEAENEKSVRELKENLTREHRAELDNIRSRFKLMTMERSPSETNLEKIDQIKEECEKQKKEAVEKALLAEREKLREAVEKIKADFDSQREKIVLDSELKEKQICALLDEIRALKEKRENLESENDSLTETRKCEDMAASVGLFEGKVDAATSPVKHRDKLTKSQTSLIKSGKLSIDSCSLGDIVLVIWDQKHENYMILQESSTLYFLHTDCIDTLGLKKGEAEERKAYCVGQVTNKDYCHARKAQNRYKVPVGTKFYRVTTKPVILNADMTKSAEPSTSKHQSQQLSDSQTIETAETDSALRDSGPSSTPITPARSKSNMESSIVTQDVSQADSSSQSIADTPSESNR